MGLGALGLLVSLFLDWYSPQLSAFDAFEFLDWTLAACAVLSLVGVALVLSGTPSTWLPYTAGLAFFVAASQIVDPPPAAHGSTREVGAWLGLGCAMAMAIGVALAAASIAITVDVRGRERRRRVAAVDRRESAAAGDEPPAAAEAPPPDPRRAGLFTDTTPDDAEDDGPDPQRTQPLSPVDREAKDRS